MDVKPDLVVVSSPPLFIGREVHRFCRREKSIYVIDIMDAWPETFERVVPRWSLYPMRRIAGTNYRGAAGISAVTKGYLDMAADYGAECPMHLCYHGIQFTRSSAGGREISSSGDSTIRLVYIGNMSLSYDLATVVDAVKADAGLLLDLAGSGPDEPSLRRRAADCERIRFHGYLGESDLRKLLSDADVGVVPMFDDSCVGVPYKLADYAAAGLPVASSLHGETAELLETHMAGVTYSAGNATEFSSAVRQASRIDRAQIMSLADLFDSDRLYQEYVRFASCLPLVCDRNEQ